MLYSPAFSAEGTAALSRRSQSSVYTTAIFPHKGWPGSPGRRGHCVPPNTGMVGLCELSTRSSGLVTSTLSDSILALATRTWNHDSALISLSHTHTYPQKILPQTPSFSRGRTELSMLAQLSLISVLAHLC